MRVPGWMPLEIKILDLHKEFRQPEMLLYFKIFQSGPFKKYRDTHLVVAKTAVIPPLTVWRLIEFSLIKHYDHLPRPGIGDRKSTRLNSSHVAISYAVFCLKKKKLTEK